MQINVNIKELEAEIVNLQSLLDAVKTDSAGDFDIGCKGVASEWMSTVNGAFLGLEEALQTLINVTIMFCQNAKDGYIDADENTAKLLEAIQAQFQEQ